MTFKDIQKLGEFKFIWNDTEDRDIQVRSETNRALGYYKLNVLGWGAIINRRLKTVAGQCNYTKKHIIISEWLINLNTFKEVEETIKHEIAHALSKVHFNHRGHGYKWKAIAIAIGDDGVRCYSTKNVNVPTYKWSLNCPTETCILSVGYHRKPKANKSCHICDNVYNPEFKLVLKQNF